MRYLEAIDHCRPEFGEVYDELPLWSAPFGLCWLDRVPIRSGMTIDLPPIRTMRLLMECPRTAATSEETRTTLQIEESEGSEPDERDD